ncbi:MAG: hypothetical protein HN882_03975, partial [Planctomycetaceae bacterium]|nr:hypothetical protein [Planctomycetaceae bacterium]
MLQKNITIDRRGLLKVGALTLGSTAFAFSPWGGALQGKVVAGNAQADSVLVLWMAGGVTQFESFDPKMEAPLEVRGRLQD